MRKIYKKKIITFLLFFICIGLSYSMLFGCNMKQYIVKYNKNKPTDASDLVLGYILDQKLVKNERDNLLKNKFSLFGWNFVSWNTKKDGTGIKYNDMQRVSNIAKPGDTLVLYAQWEPVHYEICYINQDYLESNIPKTSKKITGEMKAQFVKYDQKFKLERNNYALEGWKFIGWRFGLFTYSDEQEVYNLSYNGKTVNFYAKWERIIPKKGADTIRVSNAVELCNSLKNNSVTNIIIDKGSYIDITIPFIEITHNVKIYGLKSDGLISMDYFFHIDSNVTVDIYDINLSVNYNDGSYVLTQKSSSLNIENSIITFEDHTKVNEINTIKSDLKIYWSKITFLGVNNNIINASNLDLYNNVINLVNNGIILYNNKNADVVRIENNNFESMDITIIEGINKTDPIYIFNFCAQDIKILSNKFSLAKNCIEISTNEFKNKINNLQIINNQFEFNYVNALTFSSDINNLSVYPMSKNNLVDDMFFKISQNNFQNNYIENDLFDGNMVASSCNKMPKFNIVYNLNIDNLISNVDNFFPFDGFIF